MTIGKNFTTKIASAFVTFTLASFFMCSCSESTPEKVNLVEPIPSDSTATDVKDSADTTSKKDSIPNTPDSSKTDSAETSPIETTHTVVGYLNRGQYAWGTEVVLRELDSNLAQTGVVYRTLIADSLGLYVIPDVKLTQPYVHIEAVGSYNTVCYEIDNRPEYFTGTETYADIRKGDTINLNVLTHMQARRLPRYIEQGYSFDSAMATLQSEISALLMLDTLHTEFTKLNLVSEQSESFYLLGATILSEVHSFSGDFDGILALESLNDSTTSSFWYQAYNASTGRGCWKITENSRKFGYHYIITGAKKYLEQVWKTKFDLGECSVANKNEIKSAAFNSKYVMYCDSAKWQYPHDCSVLDKIVLDTTVGDTIAGHLTEAPYCKDTYYYWGTFQGEYSWLEADNIETGLKLACVKETRGLYGKSGKKCYYCDGSYWLEKDMTECDEHIVSAGQTN